MKINFTRFKNQNRLNAVFGKIKLACLFAMATAVLHAENGPLNRSQLNNLSLGGAVWAESDNNGMKHTRYDGANLMDAGLIGVTVRLYADTNNDGIADGPVLASQVTNNYGQYTFANLAPGHYVVGVQKPAGNFDFISVAGIADPDNNIDEDNNGVISTLSGELRSLAITLTAGLEPTYDGDNANGNRTLDFAFQVMIGIHSTRGGCTMTASTGTQPLHYGYYIGVNQFNTSYPPTYYSYAYQYRNAAGNWVCFTNGINTINGAQVLISNANGTSVSTVPINPLLGNVPSLQFKPVSNAWIAVVPVGALQGLVVRCVLSLGQNTDACSMPANNTFNSGQNSVNWTIDFTTVGCQNVLPPSNLVSSARDEEPAGTKLNIYPNPAKGPVQLEFKGHRGNYMISLYDQSGRLAASQQVLIGGEHQFVTLNRGRLKGNYLLQVREHTSGKLVESRQVLLQ